MTSRKARVAARNKRAAQLQKAADGYRLDYADWQAGRIDAAQLECHFHALLAAVRQWKEQAAEDYAALGLPPPKEYKPLPVSNRWSAIVAAAHWLAWHEDTARDGWIALHTAAVQPGD